MGHCRRYFNHHCNLVLEKKLTQNEFKSRFVQQLIEFTLNIIRHAHNKDSQELKHLFDSMVGGLIQIKFQNKEVLCSEWIRSDFCLYAHV